MKFFGKEIPTDKINFVINIVSFVLGVIFFVRMQFKMNETPSPVLYNSEHDSLISIQARIKTQLAQIKIIQDSIVQSIEREKSTIKTEDKSIAVHRKQLQTTINCDWETLSRQQQDTYISQIISNLKKQKSP